MLGNNNGLSPGDMGDPVAQSIRNEQMHDARPSDAEIAKAKKKAHTCDRCGLYDEERVSLRMYENYRPDCHSIQCRREPLGSLCENCYDPTTKVERIANYFEDDDKIDFVVEYSCGMLNAVSGEYNGDQRFPPQRWSPSVPIKNARCGHLIDRVWTEDDLEDDDDS